MQANVILCIHISEIYDNEWLSKRVADILRAYAETLNENSSGQGPYEKFCADRGTTLTAIAITSEADSRTPKQLPLLPRHQRSE